MEQSVVQSVERTFKIIELLSQNPNGMGLLEISKNTELHKSTVHRLLLCLINMGYVIQDDITGIYRLSLKLFELSSRLVESNNLVAVAKPYLDNLSETVKEAVHLVVPSSSDIVYVYKIDFSKNSAIKMASRVGLSIPMYCTACGKAILANMPLEYAQNIWNSTKINKLTTNTIIDFEKLKKQFEQIKTDGYAIDNEENELGVICVALPILDYNKKPIGAFSISAPSSRMTKEKIKEIVPIAKETLEKIITSLGYNY